MIIFFVAACACLYLFHASWDVLWVSSNVCVFPLYAPGLVGGMICDVTCCFLARRYCSIQCRSDRDHVFMDLHIPLFVLLLRVMT